MSRYRKVPTSTWDQPFYRALSKPPACGQVLWFRLITGPETSIIPGVLTVGEAALSEALGWRLGDFRRVFRELVDQDLVRADWSARVVFIPSVLAEAVPESPNVLRAWRTLLDELPPCALTETVRRAVEDFVEGLTEGFQEAFREGSRKAFVKVFRKSRRIQDSGHRTQDQEHPPTPRTRGARVRSHARRLTSLVNGSRP
jgi:hypothetical protein